MTRVHSHSTLTHSHRGNLDEQAKQCSGPILFHGKFLKMGMPSSSPHKYAVAHPDCTVQQKVLFDLD